MRTGALIGRIARQMLRDKRTLALLFVAPLLILTLIYYVFNGGESDPPRVGMEPAVPALVLLLDKAGIEVVPAAETEGLSAEEAIKKEELDAYLAVGPEGKLELTLENGDPSKARALQSKIAQLFATEGRASLQAGAPPPEAGIPPVEIRYLYGDAETNFFDVLSPILVGFFVFFFVFLIAGIGLLRERTTGTLERLMSTPIRRGEVLAGYLAGYGLFAVVQTVIVVLYAIHVLDLTLAGSIWNVLLVNLLLALVALSLGILLSTFASSEFQMVQFIPLVIVPQVFFAGIFPMEGMAEWLQILGRIMPLYYGADALQGVMYRGEGIGDVYGDLLTLCVFAALFIALNVKALKKYRK